MSVELMMPSNHLISCHPLLLPSIFPSIRVNKSGGQSVGVLASASVLPMNIQDWFPLGWTGSISLQSKGVSRVFYNTTVQKHQFMVHVLLKPGLKDFEHYFASMWDEYNCAVVWTFFGIAFLWDWNENWPFPVLWPLLSFQICWHIECSTFIALSFRIWNSSTGIPSSPLALFVVTLPKARLVSHSRMSGSRWVIIPSWFSGLWRSFLYSFSVYSCPLFLISSASVRSLPFLSFTEPIFAWNVPWYL